MAALGKRNEALSTATQHAISENWAESGKQIVNINEY